MRELLEQIETRQAAARDLADRLREQITQFAAQLAEAERRLERLEIARETLLEIAQDTDTGDLDPGGFPLIVDTGCYAALVSVVDRCSKAIGLIWPRRECRRRVL
ncbi:hypothetical protein OG723_40390 [Streptomyces sp. NBC_01278]|uniref:hypothetical protein n=1 Tax=Streptomyces sp. NBC_01278 TaxID=2903809 RepID=UPI002E2FF02F|nr:hypothetical protein [Streptomyces sp. NBC_01278]